jgi:hypothetical protein
MADDRRHPLDRAFVALREATLRRAAAREAGAEDTQRILAAIVPPSARPSSAKTKFTAAVGAVGGVLWALWELYLLLRGR